MYRVMIADDEPIVRKALQVLTNWESIDCQIVYIASDGQEVIDNIANTNPDIIITDIKMPVADGLSIAKYVKENALPIKVIFLTAYADFSYARTALQYGVTDYVTKDGGFDGLQEALENAKKLLAQEKAAKGFENKTAVIENFLKSLIDGSIYDEEEILSKAEQYGVCLHNFMLLMFCFRADAKLDKEKKDNIVNSLFEFFGVGFQKQRLFIISVKRNMLCVLLDDVGEKDIKDIRSCCDKTGEILKSFMKLDVHIGGSGITRSLQHIKEAYNEAEEAVRQGFYSKNYHVSFYEPPCMIYEKKHLDYQHYVDDTCYHVRKGEREKALESFERLFQVQLENHTPQETIKKCGGSIGICCQNFLKEYDVTTSEVMEHKRDISQAINNCFRIEEYRAVMVELIGRTSEFIAQSVNRKDVFIHECEKIIKENVENYISVSEIAERLGVSGSYLSRIFKEKTGSTVINAINRAKLETAQDLLKNTDMKIYEIADRLGFENITYFSHFFKKHMNISPVEYKKQTESQDRGSNR